MAPATAKHVRLPRSVNELEALLSESYALGARDTEARHAEDMKTAYGEGYLLALEEKRRSNLRSFLAGIGVRSTIWLITCLGGGTVFFLIGAALLSIPLETGACS